MVRKRLDEADARRLLGGAPVLLVTSHWRAINNVLPVAWAMPMSVNPPLVGIAIHASRHSHDLIRYGEAFAINIPGQVLLNHTQWSGMVSGLQMDKLAVSRLPHFKARHIDAPLLEGCVGWIECTVFDSHTVGDHTLYIGKVVSCQVDSDAWDTERNVWALTDDEYKPLHYLGGNLYALLNAPFAATVQARSAEEMEAEGFGRELESVEEERRRKREEEMAHRDEEARRGEQEPTRTALPRERPEA